MCSTFVCSTSLEQGRHCGLPALFVQSSQPWRSEILQIASIVDAGTFGEEDRSVATIVGAKLLSTHKSTGAVDACSSSARLASDLTSLASGLWGVHLSVLIWWQVLMLVESSGQKVARW